MQHQPQQSYEFGPFHLDPVRRVLLREGEPVPLTPKVFDTLLTLVERSGQVLAKDELMQRLWPDSFVEEGNLTVTVSMLRKALGENRGYIVTLPGRGYRFVADVRESFSDGVELVVEESAKAHVIIKEETSTADEPATALGRLVALWQRLATRGARAAILLGVLLAAAVIAFALWRGTRPAPPAGIHSLAVLPFRPLTPDTNEDYLKVGITDTLITRLSSVKPLVVRPFDAVSGLDPSSAGAADLGRRLKVDAVVEGSVQKAGDQIRLNVKLVATSGETPLWAHSYDGKVADLFRLQDQISKDLVSALGVRLSGEERERLAGRPPANPQAYQLYLQARALWSQRTPILIPQVLALYNQVIALDPTYALAYAGRADCYMLMGGANGQYHDRRRGDIALAREAAQRALELDNSLAEVHTTLGLIYLHGDWNWAGAEREFTRAIELNPNYATAHLWYSNYLFAMGRFDEALQEARRAYELEPLSPDSGNVARALLFARRYDDAIAQCQQTLEMPNSAPTYFLLGAAYEQQGRYPEAIAAYQRTLYIPGIGLSAQATLAQGYGKAGQTNEALRILHELEQRAQHSYVAAFYFAQVYIGLGDKDHAMQWLNKAYDEHLDDLVYLKADVTFDPLRDDPRFHDLLHRVGLE